VSEARQLLLVESDPSLCRLVQFIAAEDDFSVTIVDSLESALSHDYDSPFDIILAGSRTVDIHGIPLLQEATGAPLLVLSGGGVREAVELLERTVADDFLSMPFGPEDFLSRIRFLLGSPDPRRKGDIVVSGDIEVDLKRRIVTMRAGNPVPLSESEWRLVEALCRATDGILLAEETLVKIWGPEYAAESGFLAAWIDRLNRKLSPDRGPAILPFHGIGYRLASPPLRA
jgi:two-component system KDP operon response regulator KdpE